MNIYRDLGSKKHVDDLFEKGELRISSLFKFRDLENPERKDESEGIKLFVGRPQPNKKGEFALTTNLNDQNGKRISDYGLVCEISIANCFALSFFLDEKQGSSIVKIKDIKGFTEKVGNEIHKKGKELLFSYSSGCRYNKEGDKREHVFDIDDNFIKEIDDEPLKSVFLKSNRFENDREYRIVWFPNYYDRAILSIEQLVVSYGYQPHNHTLFWPSGTSELPNENEMIDEYLTIFDNDLLRYVERT
jgi:hypothetical protein